MGRLYRYLRRHALGFADAGDSERLWRGMVDVMSEHPQLGSLRRVRDDLLGLHNAARANGDTQVASMLYGSITFVDWAITEATQYRCPRCGAISHNPNDRAQRYCDRCKQFEVP